MKRNSATHSKVRKRMQKCSCICSSVPGLYSEALARLEQTAVASSEEKILSRGRDCGDLPRRFANSSCIVAGGLRRPDRASGSRGLNGRFEYSRFTGVRHDAHSPCCCFCHRHPWPLLVLLLKQAKASSSGNSSVVRCLHSLPSCCNANTPMQTRTTKMY